MLPQHKVALCSFSMGKDSIATYLEIREHFEQVVPFYLYGVPDLEFVENNLKYYEDKIGRHIIRLPQPKFYAKLNALLYQPPVVDRWDVIFGWNLPDHTHRDIHSAVCACEGLDEHTTYTAIGLRYADSPQRRTALARNGLVTHSMQKFYPIAHYTKQDVLDKVKGAGWKLSSDYKYFKDSMDGLQIRYLLPIKKHFPRDYEKILEWFPLAEMEILRYERFIKDGGTQAIKEAGRAKATQASNAAA